MAMATLRLKPRTKGVEGDSDQQAPATLITDKGPHEHAQATKAPGAPQAPYGSLREYLKATH
jgi:hypothetical protein